MRIIRTEYQVGKLINKIHCMDCLNFLSLLPDNIIDLVITSPPYNTGIDYGIYKDNLPFSDYLCWCRKWLLEIRRTLKDDGRFCFSLPLVITTALEKERVLYITEFGLMVKDVGLKIHGTASWTDHGDEAFTAWGSWISASSPYVSSGQEIILIGYKNIWKKRVKGVSDITKKDFMMGCSGYWKLGRYRKKTEFPEKLPQLCIQLFSYMNDLILDPFAGSGTSLVAAKKLGRNFLGCEIEPICIERTNKRLGDVEDCPY